MSSSAKPGARCVSRRLLGHRGDRLARDQRDGQAVGPLARHARLADAGTSSTSSRRRTVSSRGSGVPACASTTPSTWSTATTVPAPSTLTARRVQREHRGHEQQPRRAPDDRDRDAPPSRISWRRARLRRARARSANRAIELGDTTGGATGPPSARARPARRWSTDRPKRPSRPTVRSPPAASARLVGAARRGGSGGALTARGSAAGARRRGRGAAAVRAARAAPAGSCRVARSRRGATGSCAVARVGELVEHHRRQQRHVPGADREQQVAGPRRGGDARAAASSRSATNVALPGVGTRSTISAPVTAGSGSSRAA